MLKFNIYFYLLFKNEYRHIDNLLVLTIQQFINKFLLLLIELGTAIAKRNAKLIHGGGKAGLMGKIVIAAHKAGGQSLGIVAPQSGTYTT